MQECLHFASSMKRLSNVKVAPHHVLYSPMQAQYQHDDDRFPPECEYSEMCEAAHATLGTLTAAYVREKAEQVISGEVEIWRKARASWQAEGNARHCKMHQ